MTEVVTIQDDRNAVTVTEELVTVTVSASPGIGIPTGGTAGQILTKDSSTDYDTSWQNPAGGPTVLSVFGRTGSVIAVAGDYNASQITYTPSGSISALTVQDAIAELDSEKQPLDATLTAIAALTTTGFVAIGSGGSAASSRTITGTNNQVNVANGTGASGNPTLSLPQDIHTGANPTFAGMNLTALLDVTYGYPMFRVRNSDPNQFAGAAFLLTNTTSTMANQAGVSHYMGINDSGASQGFYAIDKTNVSGGGTGHLILFDYNADLTTIYQSVSIDNAKNLSFGTTTGTKIGTTTTQKIGLWNATPIVQGAAIADATASTVSIMTQLNLLLAFLRTWGAIST